MQSKAERPVAVVQPFSINNKQMCVNCENWETISGMLGLCEWCEKHALSSQTSSNGNGDQQPIVLGGGGAGGASQHPPDGMSPQTSTEAGSQSDGAESVEFSQEGQRWTFSEDWAHDWEPAEII